MGIFGWGKKKNKDEPAKGKVPIEDPNAPTELPPNAKPVKRATASAKATAKKTAAKKGPSKKGASKKKR